MDDEARRRDEYYRYLESRGATAHQTRHRFNRSTLSDVAGLGDLSTSPEGDKAQTLTSLQESRPYCRF